jgi:hypothetical protein
MAERKAFALRLRADVFNALRRWADDDMRSVNAQIEYLLRDALHRAGRLPTASAQQSDAAAASDDGHDV